jgi:hypothetical protein
VRRARAQQCKQRAVVAARGRAREWRDAALCGRIADRAPCQEQHHHGRVPAGCALVQSGTPRVVGCLWRGVRLVRARFRLRLRLEG